jgi:hypothetical protein
VSFGVGGGSLIPGGVGRLRDEDCAFAPAARHNARSPRALPQQILL